MRRALSLAALLLACSTRPTTPTTGVSVRGAVTAAARYEQPRGPWAPPPDDGPYYDTVTSLGGHAAALQRDPLLAAVAREVARRLADDPSGRSPSARLVQGLAWEVGLSDPIPTVFSVRAPGAAGAAWNPGPDVQAALRAVVEEDQPTHFGVARATHGADAVVVYALSQRRVTLAPFARTFTRGDRVTLRGALGPTVRAPTMELTRPDGTNEQVPLGAGPSFTRDVALDAPGVWQIELTADSDAGNTVVANFPLYVDQAPPAVADDVAPSGAPEAPAQVEESLLALINASRAHARLSPLARLASLDDVARGHARDMADHHYVAHTSPTFGSMADRLHRANVRTGLALENVARGYGAREIHDALMASPGHRANILGPTVTHVGIGVVPEAGGASGLLVTQDFIEVAGPLDVARAAATVLDRVNARRASHHAPPFARDPGLDAIAAHAAQGYYAHPERPQDAVMTEVGDAVRGEGARFRRISATAAVGPRVEGAEDAPTLDDAAFTRIGIGVAQGDRPDAPPGSVMVVFVVATPR